MLQLCIGLDLVDLANGAASSLVCSCQRKVHPLRTIMNIGMASKERAIESRVEL